VPVVGAVLDESVLAHAATTVSIAAAAATLTR
jgi:hypothetical protein